MNLQENNWKFDNTVVPVFDEHVRQSVPLYNEIHNLIVDISGWFLDDDTNVYDIGTSTGKVISSLYSRYKHKDNIRYIGIDNSVDMYKKASDTFKENDNVKIELADITEGYDFDNASLITSVLTMQFIQERYRQDIVNDIYQGLNRGSAFILVEKIIGSNARFNEIWTELYHEMKLKNGLTEEHVFAKAKAIRGVMRPYTVSENLEMLKASGFRDVDIFFKWNNFAGFVAIK